MRLLAFLFECVVAVTGLAVFFGDVFFWHGGNFYVHSYSVLTLLAWTLGGLLLMLDRLELYVLYVVCAHLFATLGAALVSQSLGVFPILLICTDIGLMLIASTQHHVRDDTAASAERGNRGDRWR